MTLTASPVTRTTTPDPTSVAIDQAPASRTVRARLAAWFQRRVDAYVANNASQFGGSVDLLPMQLLAVRPSPNFF